jgi:hypothetical protein
MPLWVRSALGVQVLAILPALAIALVPARAANLIDHHQHLVSPQALSVFSAPKAITATDLIAQMDAAGIGRAVVLSERMGSRTRSRSPARMSTPVFVRRMTGPASK